MRLVYYEIDIQYFSSSDPVKRGGAGNSVREPDEG